MKGELLMDKNLLVPTDDARIFFYKDGQQVRTTEIDGDTWFFAKDVCDILEIKNARDAMNALDNDEKMTVGNSDGHSGKRGGAQNYNVINESGLYTLILRSTKPEAKPFRRWVTHEVLPSIRKHGAYLTKQALDTLSQKYVQLQKQYDEQRGLAALGKLVLASTECYTVQNAAQFLAQHGYPIGQNRLYKRCRDKKLLGSRKGKQYNMPTQKAIENGLFAISLNNGSYRPIAMVTPKCLQQLVSECEEEYFPLIALITSEEIVAVNN